MMCAELEQLRTELADRAYELDRRGQAGAADLAAEISARLAQLIATHAAGDAKTRTLPPTRDHSRPVRAIAWPAFSSSDDTEAVPPVNVQPASRSPLSN